MPLSPTQFAAFVRQHFEVGTLYGLEATARRLRIAGSGVTALGFWEACRRAGWAEYYAGNDEYWLTNQLPK